MATALGAAAVFIFKRVNDKILNSMQGFAAGIMIAASFWSLLQPAINYGEGTSLPWLQKLLSVFYWAGIYSCTRFSYPTYTQTRKTQTNIKKV